MGSHHIHSSCQSRLQTAFHLSAAALSTAAVYGRHPLLFSGSYWGSGVQIWVTGHGVAGVMSWSLPHLS